MKIIQNPDADFAHDWKKRIKKNNGFCPSSMTRTENDKCMCLAFRKMTQGMCPCGLYIKYEDDE